ncbi:SUN domain-containing protein 1 [Bienertia sinuspersici]
MTSYRSVAYDRSSAPKQCRVSGWFQGQKAFEDSDKAKMFLLTDFSYDLEKSNAQTFNVLDETRTAVVDTIIFEFSSNHGSPTHTCIYRLRVHGHEPESIPLIAADS